MKKIIMSIMLMVLLASLGGCFIPYHGEDGRRHPRHDRDRDDRPDRRDRDDRHEQRR